jgi:magnesium transporter
MGLRDDETLRSVTFETAAEHVARRVPTTRPEATAGEIRAALVGQQFDCATDVAVCEDGHLLGLLPLESLLAAPADAPARTIMDPDPPVVTPGADQEHAAWKAVQHGESSLAVVDASGRFVGLIPPQRLLAVLLAEHHEDMTRLAGVLRGTRSAQQALEEPVAQRFLHRLPWLLVGLGGMLLGADLVGAFERELQTNLVLAFFLPAVVYLADAVGTQTEALVVRGLSVGVPIGRVVGREFVTGILIGLGLGLVAMALGLWRWGPAGIALVLMASLAAACLVATLVGIGLPWLLHRAGSDPAFGAGPLATVIQDLLSIVIYLSVARALLP